MKRALFLACLIASAVPFTAAAQPAATPPVPWSAPEYAAEGKAPFRSEFISFDIREHAEKRDLEKNQHYIELKGEWRANHATTAGGGVKGFHLPSYSVAAWEAVQIPNLSTAGASPLARLAPPALPEENPLVQYRAEIEIPYLWLDRDLYLHIEGVGGAYALYVNDRRIGYSEDSRTPAEYYISPAVTDGLNSVGIEVYGFSTGSWLETLLPNLTAGSLGKVYLYSQPKLHIEDFVITTRPDTTGKHILADIAVVMANTYGGTEKITLGYDIYNPAGELKTYNLFETEIEARSSDTLRFREYLYGAFDKIGWSPGEPNLYTVMLYTRRDGRIIEYIPLKLGIKWVDVQDGELYVNGKRAELHPALYNADPDRTLTERQLKALKKAGYNTLCVSYPQSAWFYEMCDRIGFYVVDQANINAGYHTGNRNVGGTLANRPDYLPAFFDRTMAMRGRSKNYACVLALSLGGDSGNGYNFYKTYQWLKANDTIHPVVYRDVQGEWNSDAELPRPADVQDVLKSAAQSAPTARRR